MNFDQKCQFPYMDNSKISLFYKEVVLSWHTTNIVNCPPTNVFQIKNEIIWGNRYILSNNKTLYMKRWIDADITHISRVHTVGCKSTYMLTTGGKFRRVERRL